MNDNQYLAEMRAGGYRFEVVHKKGELHGVCIWEPYKPHHHVSLSRMHELEAWRRANLTTRQLADAVIAAIVKSASH